MAINHILHTGPPHTSIALSRPKTNEKNIHMTKRTRYSCVNCQHNVLCSI